MLCKYRACSLQWQGPFLKPHLLELPSVTFCKYAIPAILSKVWIELGKRTKPNVLMIIPPTKLHAASNDMKSVTDTRHLLQINHVLFFPLPLFFSGPALAH